MPDNKSLYDKLNNLYRPDSHVPGAPRGLISAAQLSRAKAEVRSLSAASLKALKALKHLRSAQEEGVCAEIKHLATHALAVLHNTTYSDRLLSAVDRIKFDLRKLMTTARFLDVTNLVLASIAAAVLSKQQKAAASSGVRATYRFTKQEFLNARESASFHKIFTSGVNAMNGSLASYVSRSQMYILHQLDILVDRVKKNISRQGNLSVMAKYLAERDIDNVWGDAKDNVMVTTSFMGLKKIQRRCIKGLGRIADDQDRTFSNLTEFTHFTNQLTAIVTKLSRLSTDMRLRLETKIDRYQRHVLTGLHESADQINSQTLEHKKRYLAQVVIQAVSRGYQQEIIRQTLDLNKPQRKSLVRNIQAVTDQIIQRFQPQNSFKGTIKQNLIDVLKHLNEEIASRKSDLAYHNQVYQLVHDFQVQINGIYYLSAVNKKRLRAQVVTFGNHVQETKPHRQISAIRARLQKLLHQQIQYLTRSILHHQLRDLDLQVRISHLETKQKRYLLRRLSAIREDAKASYSDKQLLIKDVRDYGLSLDKSENLRKLTSLNEIIYQQVKSLDISAAQGQALSQDFAVFSQRIGGVTRLDTIDHLEQIYENRMYGCLYHPRARISSLKLRALQFPVNQVHEAHRQVNLFVLQPQLSRYINDDIDRYLNSHLYQILKSNNARDIKRQLVQIDHGVRSRISRALALVKKEYLAETNDLSRSVYHQVIAYRSPRRIMDETQALSSRISSRLNGAGDLLQLESANQQGRRALNAYASRIIGKIDSTKASAHHSVDLMTKSILKQLKHDPSETTSGEVSSASRNLVLNITSRNHYYINQSLNQDLLKYCRNCRAALNRILRRNCLQEWLRVTERAKLRIQRLFYVPIDPRMESLRVIQQRELQVAHQIKNSGRNNLSKILRTDKNQIQQIVRHSVYLDSTKRQARQKLDQLIKKIRRDVKKFTNGKVTVRALRHLSRLNRKIDQQLLDCHDKEVQGIYQHGCKQLSEFGLKTIQKAEFKRFDRNTGELEKQIHQLPLVASKEFQKIDARFNISYHKAIYNIHKSSDISYCLHNERQGEKAIRDLLAECQKINDQKKEPYQNIKTDVKNAKSQVKSLKSLQKKDKDDSYHLLSQIDQQISHQIKEAVGIDNASKVLQKGLRMVKQVIDKVSSAGVLVSAIKTANNQIVHSTLDDKQKKATLHQINQIVNSGIRSQFIPASSDLGSASSNHDRHQKRDQHKLIKKDRHNNHDHKNHDDDHHHDYPSAPKKSSAPRQKKNAQPNKKKHKHFRLFITLLDYLLNCVATFFSHCQGVLGRSFL